MADFILDLFELSAVMAAAVIVLLLLRKPVGSRFSAWSRYLVWTLVVIRLCVPVGAGLADPVFTVTLPEKVTADVEASEVTQAETIPPAVEQTEKTEQTLPPETGALTEAVTQSTSPAVTIPPSVVMPAESEAVRPQVTLPSVKEPTLESEKTPTEIDTRRVLSVIGYLWLAGALGYFAFRMGAYTLFTVRMKRELRSADGRVLRIYETLCTQLNIKRVPRLFVSRVPVSPMLYGYISPRIVIPDLEFADEEKICQMLIHELIHHRRGDIYVKLLCTAAIAVHWFNPAAHVAASRCVSAMELACDEAVVRTMNESSRARYGETLLEIVRRCADVRTSSMTTGMNSRRSNVKERIMNILDTNKKKRGITIVAAVLCICMIAGGVVGCAVGDNAEKTDIPETDNATYYVPEYMKIVDLNDTYEAKLSFEGDTLVAERTKNGEADVTYTALYDGERLTAVEVRNAEGELIRTKSLSYDENGNVKYIRHMDAAGSINFGCTEYTYENGALKSIFYKADNDPTGVDIRCFYDKYGRISAVKISNGLFKEIGYTYDGEGRIVKAEYYGSPDPYYSNLKKIITTEFRDDGRTAVMTEEYKSSGKSDSVYTYSYDDSGKVLTARVDCELGIYDADNVPNYALQTNTYSDDGRHIICQTVEGNNFTLENSFREYRGSFDSEKLESSQIILHGSRVKWRECSEAEYLCYRAVYEAFDTVSEESEVGYLLDLESHMWCFDDVVSDISVDTEAYTVFEGNATYNEVEARKVWYEANGFSSGRKSGIVEAFLTSDVDKLAEYAYAAEGAYESYIGMKLGNYTLESRKGKYDNRNFIVLTVDILESNHEILVPGTHTFIAEEGINVMLYPENMYESIDNIVYEELFNKRAGLLLRHGVVDFEEFKNGINGEYNKLATYLCIYGMHDNMEKYYEIMDKNDNKGFLAEDIKAYAEKYLGVSDFDPPKEHGTNSQGPYSYHDSYYNIIGRGSSAVAFSYEEQVVDGDRVTVTITGWADQSMTVKSKTVEYVFEKLDESVKIISSRVLEDTGYELSHGQGT